MKSRTHQEWRELFKQQAEGELSVAEFCKQHNIGQSYFYKRKSDLSDKNSKSIKNRFIKIKAQPNNTSLITSVELHHQQTRLIFPVNVSPSWLPELVKAIA